MAISYLLGFFHSSIVLYSVLGGWKYYITSQASREGGPDQFCGYSACYYKVGVLSNAYYNDYVNINNDKTNFFLKTTQFTGPVYHNN